MATSYLMEVTKTHYPGMKALYKYTSPCFILWCSVKLDICHLTLFVMTLLMVTTYTL